MGTNGLKIIERCLDKSSFISLKILVGMVFGSTDLLSLEFEIISIISFFVRDEMKNGSSVDKYSKNVFMNMVLLTELLALRNRRNLKLFGIVR